ncbi:helix-turn-helix domain-containing protein [Streptomyces sp. NPDC059396]|uniref:helix-turn-helix domain-containing protein n=1 Tax=Streptomyces sp. NPDC059396 TaxID=3346819 RepID=UPI0036BBDD9E
MYNSRCYAVFKGTGQSAGDFYRAREQRRLRAGRLFEQGGRSDAEIARQLGVSAQANVSGA